MNICFLIFIKIILSAQNKNSGTAKGNLPNLGKHSNNQPNPPSISSVLNPPQPTTATSSITPPQTVPTSVSPAQIASATPITSPQPASTSISPAPTASGATFNFPLLKQMILSLSGTKPRIYFTRNAQNEFVFCEENSHPCLQNGGSQVTFTPSEFIQNGYKMFMDGINICSDKYTNSLKPCTSNGNVLNGALDTKTQCGINNSDPANSTWFFIKNNGGYYIAQGDQCITMANNNINFNGQWPVMLDTCGSRMNQSFYSESPSYGSYY